MWCLNEDIRLLAFSRQAAALLDSFKQFTQPLDLEIVIDGLRDERLEPVSDAERHMLADLIEAQRDIINQLKRQP